MANGNGVGLGWTSEKSSHPERPLLVRENQIKDLIQPAQESLPVKTSRHGRLGPKPVPWCSQVVYFSSHGLLPWGPELRSREPLGLRGRCKWGGGVVRNGPATGASDSSLPFVTERKTSHSCFGHEDLGPVGSVKPTPSW